MTPTTDSVTENLADATLDAIELLADRVRDVLYEPASTDTIALDVLFHAKRFLEAEYHVYVTGKAVTR